VETLDIKIVTKEGNVEDWIPYRAHPIDAGADLLAAETVIINPQSSTSVRTGVAVDIPPGYVGLVFSRSGMATKRKLRLGNCVGVIDSGYQGEIIVSVYNDNQDQLPMVQVVNIGERIAQLVIVPIVTPKFRIVENFVAQSVRGDKGFGSTGK
jgi:dUTP pyrophosphatase